MHKLRIKNLKETKNKVSLSVDWQVLIKDSVSRIDAMKNTLGGIEMIVKKWVSYFFPEHLGKDPDELLKKKPKTQMGAKLTTEDADRIKDYLKSINLTKKLIENENKYLKKVLSKKTPNLYKITKPYIIAKLIDHAGNLERLSRATSSKIQVLGAEKALFRHIRFGNKAPKFGIIALDKRIQNSENPGKEARQLASKIMIAARKDFFRKNE